MRALLTGVTLSITTIGIAHADLSGADYGLLMWRAFICSIYAEKIDDRKEQERLFKTGYESEHKFLEAVRNNQVSEQDYNEKLPWVVTLSLGGPSDDFRLGRAFSHAADYASENYDLNLDDEQLVSKFKHEFWEGGCGLLGR